MPTPKTTGVKPTRLRVKSIMFCGYAVRIVRGDERGDETLYRQLRYYRNPTAASVARVRSILNSMAEA